MPKEFSVKFQGDLAALGNPFHIQSPFGRPVTIGWGDAFAERDHFREALEAIADGDGDPQDIAHQALHHPPN